MNYLEERLLRYLIPQAPGSDVLMEQFACLSVTSRDYTGAGVFTNFQHEDISPRTTRKIESPFGNVLIESPDLEHGGGAIIFMKHGWMDCLEVFAYGDHWPKNELKEFTLKEVKQSR